MGESYLPHSFPPMTVAECLFHSDLRNVAQTHSAVGGPRAGEADTAVVFLPGGSAEVLVGGDRPGRA